MLVDFNRFFSKLKTKHRVLPFMLRSESGGEDPIYTLSTQAQNLPTRDSLETLIKDITWSAHQKKICTNIYTCKCLHELQKIPLPTRMSYNLQIKNCCRKIILKPVSLENKNLLTFGNTLPSIIQYVLVILSKRDERRHRLKIWNF